MSDPIEPSFSQPAASGSSLRSVASDGGLETIVRQVLKDQRAERRWRVAIRIGWLLLAAVLAWALFNQQKRSAAPIGPHTALVDVRGEIAVDADASAENINRALKDAFEDVGAKAVVLRINSPGGSPVQAGMVYDELKRLKDEHKKPVYAVCEELCASAAYYIAAGTDEIVVDKASIVGSIGVLMDGFGFTGTMDKLGVERRLITAGGNKGMLDPFSPLDDKHRAYAQVMVDQIHQQFIAVVREGRGKRLKESDDTFSGLFWNGQASIEQGLADRLGSLDTVARDLVKAEEIIDYTSRENLAERLAKRFGASLGRGAAETLRAGVLR